MRYPNRWLQTCRACLTLWGLLILSPAASADGGDPSGPPPEVAFDQALVCSTPHGYLKRSVMFIPVPETKTGTYTVMTKVSAETEDPITGRKSTVMKDVPEQRTRVYTEWKLVAGPATHLLTLQQVSGFEIDGTPVAPDALAARLKQPTLVVVTQDGRPLPPYYAFVFKPGTLVIGVQGAMGYADGEPEQPLVLPESIPPTFRLAKVDAEDRFALRMFRDAEQVVTAYRQTTRTVKDGEVEKEVCELHEVAVKQQMQTSATTLVPRQHVASVTAEGKPMEDVHLQALKKREYTVVVSRDGKPVDKFWLQNIKPRMLVLTPPVTMPVTTNEGAAVVGGGTHSAPVGAPGYAPMPAPVVAPAPGNAPVPTPSPAPVAAPAPSGAPGPKAPPMA